MTDLAVGGDMSSLGVLGALAAVQLAALVPPGPNTVAIGHAAASQSRQAGLSTAAGVALAATIWASVAVLGVGLLQALDWVQTALRTAGGVYLLWFGLTLLRRPGRAPAAAAVGDASWRRGFRRGLAINLGNPGTAVFFGSVFAAVLPTDLSWEMRLAAIAVVAVNSLLWHGFIAIAFSADRMRRCYARAARWIDRVMGGLVALCGAKLILSAR